MSEDVERLQKIVTAQEGEIRRMRSLLKKCRIARAEFEVVDHSLLITVTAIGGDECHFIDQVKVELEKVAQSIIGSKAQLELTNITDMSTGLPVEGAVIPE